MVTLFWLLKAFNVFMALDGWAPPWSTLYIEKLDKEVAVESTTGALNSDVGRRE